MRAGLVEHMREVCPSRGQRDAEPARCRLQPVGFQYLAREPGFRRSQPKILAEASRRTVSASSGSVMHRMALGRATSIHAIRARWGTTSTVKGLPREPKASAGAAKLVSRRGAIADHSAQERRLASCFGSQIVAPQEHPLIGARTRGSAQRPENSRPGTRGHVEGSWRRENVTRRSRICSARISRAHLKVSGGTKRGASRC